MIIWPIFRRGLAKVMDARTEFAAADAKAHFSELLTRAENGEEVLISRHGKVVAKLAPAGEIDVVAARRARRLAWQNVMDGGRPMLGPDLTIRQLIEEGRKY